MSIDALLVAETDRLTIRQWRLDEVDRWLDIYSRDEVVRWLGGPAIHERSAAIELIERNAARLTQDPRFGSWAIVERLSGVPAGTVLLKPLPNGDGAIEIGWQLHPDSWRKGLASEAAAALLERAFADGLDEVWAVTMSDNDRSARVCQRIGMRLLGITHRWYPDPSLMFWKGAQPHQTPTIDPDEPTAQP
ncbi:MAG: GNAT family N-acetyltransferase [Solirubrobacteraceae bacterium]